MIAARTAASSFVTPLFCLGRAVILGDAGAGWIVHPMINGVCEPAGLYKETT
jgi:hypothetical protein